MKAWEKAKKMFPALSKSDFIYLTCPSILNIADRPESCPIPVKVIKECIKCWDREVEV